MEYTFAPMEGITGWPFRNAHRDLFPGVSRYYTPFLDLNSNYALKQREKRDVDPKFNKGTKLAVQVMTNRADELVRACAYLSERGYEEVNLNLGCPAGTVVPKGRGAGFLKDPDVLDRFFDEAIPRIPPSVHLSVKTRPGLLDTAEAAPLMKVYNRYPLSRLIIHPRLRQQFYKGTPDMDIFDFMYGESKHPVVYNGDILTPADAGKIEKLYPDLDGIMIGRGLLIHPALIRMIQGGPSASEAEIRQFVTAVETNYLQEIPEPGNVLFKMKELWFYLSQSFAGADKSAKRIRKARSFSEYAAARDELLAVCIQKSDL